MIQNWFIPITLLPGIGLFILSTSNLSATLGNEINSLFDKEDTSLGVIRKKITQLKRLNVALTTLYVSAICFVLSGFIGSLGKLAFDTSEKLFILLMLIGIIMLAGAISLLIIFAYKAIANREEQFKERLESD